MEDGRCKLGVGDRRDGQLALGAARLSSTRSGQPTVPASRRYWCTKAIAMLPSPTAAATRLTGL